VNKNNCDITLFLQHSLCSIRFEHGRLESMFYANRRPFNLLILPLLTVHMCSACVEITSTSTRNLRPTLEHRKLLHKYSRTICKLNTNYGRHAAYKALLIHTTNKHGRVGVCAQTMEHVHTSVKTWQIGPVVIDKSVAGISHNYTCLPGKFKSLLARRNCHGESELHKKRMKISHFYEKQNLPVLCMHQNDL